MTLAVDITNGHEACCELLSKDSKVMLYLLFTSNLYVLLNDESSQNYLAACIIY